MTAGGADRMGAAPLAADPDGVIGVDAASSVSAGTTDRLVTVRNNAGQPVDVTVSLTGGTGSLTGGTATLSPGEVAGTDVTVVCGDGSETLPFRVDATAGTAFGGSVWRSTTIDTTSCETGLAFASVSLSDVTAERGPRKAEYVLQYIVDTQAGTFDRVEVEFHSMDGRGNSRTIAQSTSPNDVLRFTDIGQSRGSDYEITIRLFDASGEVTGERIERTDTADGSGIVYAAP